MKKIKVRKIFSDAWNLYKPHWKMISLFGLMLVVTGIIQQIIGQFFMPGTIIETGMFIILNIIAVVISILISMGTSRFLLNLVDTKKPEVHDFFKGAVSLKHFLKYFVISFLAGILIIFGFYALIVPGIILALGLTFVKFSAVENKHDIWEAIQYNWDLTDGYRITIFRFSLFSVFIGTIGFLALGIGLLIAIPVIQIANTMLYRKLQSTKENVVSLEN